MNQPKYYYCRHMGKYNIYRCGDPVNNIREDTKVDDARTQEEAKKKVYKLNGWKYNEKK